MDWLIFLHNLADKADQIALKFFEDTGLQIKLKTDQSPVSQADIAIEEMIRQEVKSLNLEINILGEEFGEDSQKNCATKLIIDPIDGTRNFIRGIPFFATLLAIEENNEITTGIVSAPKTADRWWAQQQKGAFHNNKQIHVSTINELSQAQAFHGSLYGNETNESPANIQKLLSKTYRQRGFGDYYAHMLVAMGCGEFAFDFGIKPWDMAPIKIILKEAGGHFSDLQGQPSIYNHQMITSNNLLHNQILDILNK
jgi:histidinol-phosphatase